MAYFIKGLDTVASVQLIRANVLKLISKGLVTTEYTVDSTDFRKEFALPPEKLLLECNQFLISELLGKPSGRRTRPYLIG